MIIGTAQAGAGEIGSAAGTLIADLVVSTHIATGPANTALTGSGIAAAAAQGSAAIIRPASAGLSEAGASRKIGA